MRSVNKVILIGNLTRDPEMRQTPNGQSVTTFGVATNRQWITKGNDKKSSTEFHECVAWAHLAEICAQYIKKGHLVYVEGYLKTRTWDSPEGIKKFKTEIVVQDMIILEKRKNNDDYVPEEEIVQEKNTPSDDKGDKENKQKHAEAEEPLPYPDSEENPIDKDLGL
ncbi:single-stranded DNA-binding protein [Candidatus Peregrinibacteria bacterium]|nr:single-stranded DNA-binding protein [Candidatus Peregrinibacteria bacterium]